MFSNLSPPPILPLTRRNPSPLDPTEVSPTSLVYGLVNIAAFLAKTMSDSIIHDTCDELNTVHLPKDDIDSLGLDDGNDIHRFPVANACGQDKREYGTEMLCKRSESRYGCAEQLNSEESRDMTTRGVSWVCWAGAPMLFYCGPRAVVGDAGERSMIIITYM